MKYRLSRSAEIDLRSIISYSLNNHGQLQTDKYVSGIIKNCKSIAQAPDSFKSLISKNQRVFYQRYNKHFILGLEMEQYFLVIAILHEKMDVLKHVSDRL